MIRIVLLGNDTECSKAELAMSEYFTEKKISFEFHYTTGAIDFLGKYLFDKDYKLFLFCGKEELLYIIKTYDNFDSKSTHMVSGKIELPLTLDKIEEQLIKNIELTNVCPYGIYYVNNHNVYRRILHEDIEYIRREKNRAIIHLRNNETETVVKPLTKISNELNRKYFVKCGNGYIINVFYVKRVNKDSNIIEMKSGALIPLKKYHFQKIVKAFAFALSGLTLCND